MSSTSTLAKPARVNAESKTGDLDTLRRLNHDYVQSVARSDVGDTAIIHARTTYRRPDGQQGAGRYTDIWMRQHGRWVCVAAQVTRG